MATNFPTSLDTFTVIPDPEVTTTETEVGGRTHSEFHDDINDAVEALEAKVGVNSSAVTSSHTYKITTLETRLDAAFPNSSVDSELVLFSGTSGEVVKRATGSGIVKITSGVASTATPGTDYVSAGAITSSGSTMTTGKLLGRTTASTGAIEEITVGSGLSMSAGTLSTQSVGASVFHSASQLSSGTAFTTLVFDSERYDTGTFHDNSTNNSRMTVLSAGYYNIHVSLNFQSITSGTTKYIKILKNGTTTILERNLRDGHGAGGQDYYFDVSIQDNPSANDYYEVQVKSSTSADMFIYGGTTNIAFEINRI